MGPTPSRRARSLRRTLNKFIAAEDATIAEQRAALERAGKLPKPRGCSTGDIVVGGVPGVRFTPTEVVDGRHLMYLHGGGYVIGSSASHSMTVARLAKKAEAIATSLDYRLAPEHPYPAAVDDAVAAFRALAADVGASNIVVAGDSAGGGLALSTMCALRDAGDDQPAAAYLLSPWTDLTASGDSVVTCADADPMLRAPHLAVFAERYAGDTALDDPGVSPLFADLTGLPPLYVQTGGDEILLDDSVRLVERARAAGVEAVLDVEPGMWHVYQAFAGLMPEADAAMDRAVRHIWRHLIPVSQRA